MRGLFFAAAVLLVCSAPASAQQIYRWVDARGITHFGAKPPLDTDAQRIDSKAPRQPKNDKAVATPAVRKTVAKKDDSAKQQVLDKQVKEQVMAEEAQRSKFCQEMRMNLAQLRNNPRLRYADESGDVHRMTEDERQKRIADTQKSIADTCRS